MAALVDDSPTQHSMYSQSALAQYQMSLGAAMAPPGDSVNEARNKKFLTRSQSVLPILLLPPYNSSPQLPTERPPKSPGYEIAPSRKKLCRSETVATKTPSEACGQRQGSPAGKPPRPNRREFRRQRTVGDMFQLVLGRGKSHLTSLFRRESSSKKSGTPEGGTSPIRSRLDSSGLSDNSSDGFGSSGSSNGECSTAGAGLNCGEAASIFSSCPDLINPTVVAMDTSGSQQPERKKKSMKQRKARKLLAETVARHSPSQPGQLEHTFKDIVMTRCSSTTLCDDSNTLDRGKHSDDMEVHDLEMSDMDALCEGASSKVICGSQTDLSFSAMSFSGHQGKDSKSQRRLTRAKTTGAWDEVISVSYSIPTISTASVNTSLQTASGAVPPKILDPAQQRGRRSPGAGSLSGGEKLGGSCSPKLAERPRATSAGLDKRVEMCGLELADLERWQSMQGLTADCPGSGKLAVPPSSVTAMAKFMSESMLTGEAGETCVIKTALHKSRSLEPEGGSRRDRVTLGVAAPPREVSDNATVPSISRVLDFLYLGTLETSTNEPLLCKLNIGALLDLSNAHSHRIPVPVRRGNECPCACFGRRHFRSRLNIAVDDIEWENIAAYFDDINSFLEGCRRGGRSVLVFSYHGKSRGPAAVAQYLMKHLNFGLPQALAHLRACKPDIGINQGFLKSLRKVDEQLAAERKTRMNKSSSNISGRALAPSNSSSLITFVPGTPAPAAVFANGNASLSPSRALQPPELTVTEAARPTVRDAWGDL